MKSATKPLVPSQKITLPAKKVSLYSIGTSPKLKVMAQIDKSGVITLTSQAAGIVKSIPIVEGQRVSKGQNLITLASNYQGANAFSIQRRIAEKNKNLTDESYQIQKDTIAKQRELAEKNFQNSDELRKINEQSIDQTKSAISLNDDILKNIDEAIKPLQDTNVGGINDAAIRGLKSQKSQLLSGNLQLSSSLRSLQYSTNTDNPPQKLAEISKDITLKQLSLQEKSLELKREIDTLQLSLAYIQESLMYPVAPFNAIVQRIIPKVGEAVVPGSPLIVLSQVYDEDPATAIAYVPSDIASAIGKGMAATVYISPAITLDIIPSFVTTEPVKGQLYAVYLPLPDEYIEIVKQGSYIYVDLPIGYPDTGSTVPFIPLEAIHQTQTISYVFTIGKDGKAQAKTVELGDITGMLVQVQKGISPGDKVILDTSIVAGDMVTTK